MWKYKIGDEVLLKAKINSNGCRSYFLETERAHVYAYEHEIVPVPTMTAEEVWEIAKQLFCGYSDRELCEIFGKSCTYHKVMDMSPEVVKIKIEAWKKEKDINVGDEVEFDDTKNSIHRSMFVTSKIGSTDYCGICKNGDTYCVNKLALKKTGRRIDIDGILEQIGV